MNRVVTRFAPSPTGHLHLGGARTAIFSWLLARHFNGKFYLRIEDTDILRSKQEYTDSILASMQWLGLDWDGEVTYQTKRTDIYNAYIDRLLKEGKAYWCSCSPDDVEAMRDKARRQGLKPKYDGHCRNLSIGPGNGHCVRLKIPQEGKIVFNDMVKGTISIDVSELDDMVLRRSDGMPTYNMAVVVDDHEMGVTHIVRGDDHISNTPRQILLYNALGLPEPVFGHVPMILGPDKQKLSKRHGARAVIEYENDGLIPQALVSYLARLGWSHGDQEIFSLEELIEYFDGTNLNPASAAFDPKKLAWCNAHFLRHMPVKELICKATPFVKKLDLWEKLGNDPEKRLEPLCRMFRERASSLIELAESFRPLILSSSFLSYAEKDSNKYLNEIGKRHLEALKDIFKNLQEFDANNIDNALNCYVNENNLKFKEVAPPLRVSLMGFMGGSHLNEIMEFLGKKETLERIDKAIENCK